MRASGIVARTVASAAAALALGAAGAVAATVQVREEVRTKASSVYHAEFKAGDGEANDLVVAPGDDGGVTFTDSGAAVVARGGCTQVTAQRAHCELGGPSAQLGDLDDRARSDTPAGIDGGPGDDMLTGAGYFNGGAGADTIENGDDDGGLSGGPGADRVAGGEGDDRIIETQDGEPDLLDGGAGRDTVDYPAARDLVIDLAAGRAGDDTLRSIESASADGGTFRGDGQANRFDSNMYPATMTGGGGPDDLVAFSHRRDRLDGGSGDDALVLFPSISYERLPERDSLRCGPGDDLVDDPLQNTIVPIDCERVEFSGERGPAVVLPRPGTDAPLGSLRWAGACAPNFEPGPCTVKAAVHEAVWPKGSDRPRSGPALGSARGRLSRTNRRIDVRPNPHGRAVIASGRCVLVRLKITGTGAASAVEAVFRLGRRCRPPAPFAQ